MESLLDHYVSLYHNDNMFFRFCFVVPFLSIASFMFFAIPLTALAYFSPAFMESWWVEKDPKRRPTKSSIIKQSILGIGFSVFNHCALVALFVTAYSTIKPILLTCVEWDDSVGFLNTPQSALLSLAQLIGCAYLEDFLYYHMHKFFHTNKFLYNNVHALHHTIRQPIAITGHYMSPLEFLSIGSTVLVTPMLLFCHIRLIFVWMFVRNWEAAEEHCGFHVPFNLTHKLIPFYDGPGYHHFHHTKVIGNYGSLTAVHDKMLNTLSKGYTDYVKTL